MVGIQREQVAGTRGRRAEAGTRGRRTEQAILDKEGWEAYGRWHLGFDTDKAAETKGRYSFPFGDFAKLHRCAVISLQSRAAQNDHDDIAKASKNLLKLIDS